ncbi:hypothetical protein [Curtobacterium sp. Arg-1]|uniref:hypothetical protein n=1 Tax=Curtobacterium sp. Arg-1 TaxID=2935040 RepID=UPI0021DB1E70|nr:hypothetical protein [Curtobacterium sp. Arg-1]UXZ57098.1 hypothetical protein MXD64_13970 [Curtobacterium sp. Arg-1]
MNETDEQTKPEDRLYAYVVTYNGVGEPVSARYIGRVEAPEPHDIYALDLIARGMEAQR